MAVQPTREDALDTGTLNQYAHLYDVDRLRQDIKTGEHGTASDGDKFGVVKGSDSITVEDGVAKVNPGIFGDGVKVEDGQVTLDIDWFIDTFGLKRALYTVGENLIIGQNNKIAPEPITSYSGAFTVVRVRNSSHYLAFYDGDLGVDDSSLGEHFAGDALYYDSEQGLMVKVGQGLHIQNDEIDIDQDGLPLASTANRGTIKVGTGLAIDAEGVLSADLTDALKALNYTFTDTLIVNITGGVTATAIAYDDIEHRYVSGIERYEAYKANFTCRVAQTYTAGTTLEFSFTFSYNGANVTSTRQTMATVIDKGTGNVVGNYVMKYTTGTSAKYTLTMPVTENIAAGTDLVVIMNYI